MSSPEPTHEASVADKALDLGGHAPGAHHRLVSHRKPAPQDIEALLIQAAEGRAIVSPARDGATRLLSRLSVGPWRIHTLVADGGFSSDYQVVLAAGALRATVQIRCLPCPHVVQVKI
ncbi:hypothetical protein [Aquabacterium sp.]|uniref:hypothetical protein n=1 Tax=Aquabacterium sp. TaxID=1872578 RepID=UPI0024888EF5|nr:hypothetical protein [Aquabacterium sp.]MDI1258390.1 hypothetical protein [Aquabacterium sp.]